MGRGADMKLVFFGTPDYVIPILNKLHKYHEVVAVVTQPPKPVGREKILKYSEVDSWAYKKKIPRFFLPAQAGDYEKLPKADMGVCASFGMIIPKVVLDIFPHGILNIHPSLLPKYRGASPIQTAIANGDTLTGVTIIKMDEQMDHGKIVTQFKEDILSDDTFQSLRERLFNLSADVLIDLIPEFFKNKINLKEQDHNSATFTKMVSRQDGFVDLKIDSLEVIERKLRAYSPWPGIWTLLRLKTSEGQAQKRLKILEFKDEPIIVQLEGKKPTAWKIFRRAYNINL